MDIFKRLFGTKNGAEEAPTDDSLSASDIALIRKLEKQIEVSFKSGALVIRALKHRSYLNVSNEDRVASNERLEFLGDAVLDLAITHYLYQKFPKRAEGQLSKIKSILVSKPVLAECAKRLELGQFLLMNKGEEKTGGRKRDSILADSFEAIIGAIYLDSGFDSADAFIKRHLLSNFKSIMQRELFKNHKSALLEFAQSEYSQPPEYRVINESGARSCQGI